MAIRYVDIVPEGGRPPKRPETAPILDPKLHEADAGPPRSPPDDLPATTEKPKRVKRSTDRT